MRLGSGNDLRTPQVRRVSTLAWRVKSVGSDHKYWPPLETAVTYDLIVQKFSAVIFLSAIGKGKVSRPKL